MDEGRAWQAEAVEVGREALWMEPGSRGPVRVQVIEELMGGNLYMVETAEGAQVVVPWQQLETPLGTEVWDGSGDGE